MRIANADLKPSFFVLYRKIIACVKWEVHLCLPTNFY